MFFRLGGHRLVIRIGPLVLKLARKRTGIICNLVEFYVYQKSKHPRLVPTYWSCGILSIQAYAGSSLTALGVVDPELYKVARQLGILDIMFYNVAADYKGSQAILDYGLITRMCELICKKPSCGCYWTADFDPVTGNKWEST